jgi:Arylsulfotransferase (ASST)
VLTRRTFLARAAGAAAALAGGGALEPFAAVASGPLTGRGVHLFVSRPDLIPPRIELVRRVSGTAPGLLFLGPSSGPGQRGAMIVDDGGELVWFKPTEPNTVMNLRVAQYKGEPVLTWWEGRTKYGLGIGEHVIVDRRYREIARFPAGNGLGADLHELILTPQGTALVTAWQIEQNVDRSSVGHGPGPVIEGLVQELDVPSAKVLFQWRGLDHIKLNESYQGVGPRFDYLHLNSIDVADDGNLLVSARNTWTVYKVDRGSGQIIWRLGGKKSDFSMGPGTAFAWQHDARQHGSGGLTVFDNADDPQVQPQTRGLVLAIDETRKRATLVRAYAHTPRMLAHAFGSVQAQPNGNVLVGWGTEPYFTEYTARGAVLLDARLPHGGENYRTLRFPWSTLPAEPPTLVARGSKLYASWNGATGVSSWQVLAGPSASGLTVRRTVPKRRFETELDAPSGAAYAAVVALDSAGKTLGRSTSVSL